MYHPQGVYKTLHTVVKLISVGKKARFPNFPGTNNKFTNIFFDILLPRG